MNTAAAACWIVIPVHDRRDTTVRCLQRLSANGVFAWARIIVVDDGSTDGTGAAVAAAFRDVIQLEGDGHLWWAGGIVRGMRHAVAEGADFILWLNDDTLPDRGALESLVAESERTGGVAGGVVYLPGEPAPAYAGYRRGFWRLRDAENPGTATVDCDALNGNLVCVPRAVIERIGYPDAEHMPHGYADFDYTLRAGRAGFAVTLVGGARAAGQPNLSLNYRSWLLSDIPLRQVWRGLGRRGSFVYQPAMQRFYARHWGIRGPLYCGFILAKLVAITVLRPVVPRAWLLRWRGRHSPAWRHEERHASR